MKTISKMHRLCSKIKSLSGITRRNNLLRFATSDSFVSKHFQPDVNEMKDVVNAMNSDTRAKSAGEFEVKICNLCAKGNKDQADNIWKLLIRKDGSYYCHRCQKGNMIICVLLYEYA